MHTILKQIEILLSEHSPLADEIQENALPLMYEHCRRRLLCRDEARGLRGASVPWLGYLSEELLPKYKLSEDETNCMLKILGKETLTVLIDPDGDPNNPSNQSMELSVLSNYRWEFEDALIWELHKKALPSHLHEVDPFGPLFVLMMGRISFHYENRMLRLGTARDYIRGDEFRDQLQDILPLDISKWWQPLAGDILV